MRVYSDFGLAGHGLTFDTVAPIAAIPQIVELNIGHFLIGEAIYVGLEAAVQEMRRLMQRARRTNALPPKSSMAG